MGDGKGLRNRAVGGALSGRSTFKVNGDGIAIALHATEAPLRETVTNRGDEPSVAPSELKDGQGKFGYNAASGQFGGPR